MSDSEGHVTWDGHRTWYRRRGEAVPGGPAPIVLLHGGPGGTHDYLEPLLDARRRRPARRALRPDRQRPQRSPARRARRVLDGRAVQARADLPARGRSASTAATSCSASRGAGCWRSSTRSTGPRDSPGWSWPTRRRACRSGSRRPTGCAPRLPADVQAILTAHEAAGTTDVAGVHGCRRRLQPGLCLPARPVARAARSGRSRSAGGPDRLRHDDRAERVPHHGHAQGLGHHRAPAGDRRADAADLGPARRGDAAHRRGDPPARRRLHLGAVRGLQPHAAPRGAGALPGLLRALLRAGLGRLRASPRAGARPARPACTCWRAARSGTPSSPRRRARRRRARAGARRRPSPMAQVPAGW